MGAFFRYDIIDSKTTGFAFLLILSCGRILLFRSPALQYAGTDRLQIVGVGSLHINGPLEMVALPWSSVQPSSCYFEEEAGRRQKNRDPLVGIRR